MSSKVVEIQSNNVIHTNILSKFVIIQPMTFSYFYINKKKKVLTNDFECKTSVI